MRLPAQVTKQLVTAWRNERMRTAMFSVGVATKRKAKHTFIAPK